MIRPIRNFQGHKALQALTKAPRGLSMPPVAFHGRTKNPQGLNKALESLDKDLKGAFKALIRPLRVSVPREAHRGPGPKGPYR